MNLQGLRNTLFKIRYGFRGAPLRIDDYTFRIDESLRRWDPTSEHRLQYFLKQYLKPGDVFIDIGANFGLHTLYGAKLVKEHGHVFAFEPAPANLKLLARNITLSGVEKQVTIIPQAVSNSAESTLKFYLPTDDVQVTASLHPNQGSLKSLEVANTRLDDYWCNVNRPVQVIKIDVEGAELEVLRGATETLRKWKPVLLVEIHGFALPDFGATVDDLQRFLSDFSYTETVIEGECFNSDYYQAIYL